MKIAYVTRELPSSPRCGGIGHYVWDIAKSLQKEGHSIVIISASDNYNQQKVYIEQGIKIFLLPDVDYHIGSNRIISYLLTYVRKYTAYKKYRQNVSNCLESLIDENEIDIVEFPEFGNEALIWAKVNRRIPMVIRLHGPTILNRNTQKPISKFLHPFKYEYAMREIISLQYADTVSAASEEMLNFVQNNFNVILRNAMTIHNFINYESWYVPIQEYIESSSIKIFSAGSVTEGKGYGELFEACKLLNNEGFNINLTIAGKLGSLGRNLQNLSKQENYKWLNILGPIERDKLKEYYSKSNISCFPSWWEPFGLVCIEAMAAGSLVIGSKEGGMNEIIDDGIDGFLVEPKDIQLLKEKIKEIIDLPKGVKMDIRKNAQQKVNDEFDSKVLLHQQLEFYKKVINEYNLRNGIKFGVNQ